MRRRGGRRDPNAQPEYDDTPERFVRFVASEWPTDEYQAAADMWWAARRDWEVETGRDAFILWDPMPPDESFDPESV